MANKNSARILVVDDSKVVLEAARMVLEEGGFEVRTADNPLTLATEVHRFKPALVLLDLNMPTIQGDAAAKIALGSGVTDKTRVVLYSDAPEDVLVRRTKECGALGFIRKTDDGDALVSAVKMWLTKEAGAPRRPA